MLSGMVDFEVGPEYTQANTTMKDLSHVSVQKDRRRQAVCDVNVD